MSNEQKGLQLNANGEIVLTFYEDFTKETCKKFMEELIAVEQVVIEQNAVNKQLAKEAQQPIPILHIKLNSYGGSMWDCFSLMNQIDLLKEYGVTVIMEAMGYICSAGFMLFLKGDVRVVTSDQVFILYHYPLTTYLHENIYRVEDDLRMTMKHFEYIENLIIKETKITKEMLEKYRREDWVMDLEEARELEVVNDVKIMKEYEQKMKKEQEQMQGITDEELEQLQEIFAELTLNEVKEDKEEIEEEVENERYKIVIPKPRERRRKRKIFKRRRK